MCIKVILKLRDNMGYTRTMRLRKKKAIKKLGRWTKNIVVDLESESTNGDRYGYITEMA